MLEVVGGCLKIDELMIHPTDSKYFFVASLEHFNSSLNVFMEHEFTVEHPHHTVVVNDDDNIVYQQLQFGLYLTFTFETTLDYLQFCKFVGLDLLPLPIEAANDA